MPELKVKPSGIKFDKDQNRFKIPKGAVIIAANFNALEQAAYKALVSMEKFKEEMRSITIDSLSSVDEIKKIQDSMLFPPITVKQATEALSSLSKAACLPRYDEIDKTLPYGKQQAQFWAPRYNHKIKRKL